MCAPKEASELAVAPAVTMAIEAVTGATIQAEGTADDKTRAEGTAGNKKGLQGSGERTGSGERCPVGHSRALKVSEEGAGAGGDGGGDAGGDEGSDDFSVSYALHYPNEFADPALEKEDLTVGEHVDPSLFVAEPCCGVEGLEILDRASERSGRGGGISYIVFGNVTRELLRGWSVRVFSTREISFMMFRRRRVDSDYFTKKRRV